MVPQVPYITQLSLSRMIFRYLYSYSHNPTFMNDAITDGNANHLIKLFYVIDSNN
jgi:hypothetical protein